LIRHMRRWKVEGRPVGVGLTRAVVLLAALSFPICTYDAIQNHRTSYGLGWGEPNWQRADLVAQLNSIQGDHLVIVRYSLTHHNILHEWVYNGADIDHAHVVWAREIPGVDIQPLLKYFQGRKVWLLEPDTDAPRLAPYTSEPPAQPGQSLRP
jgi:hypothetical protein